MNPKVSIIVPVYQAEKTITRCVDSVLKQEYGDFELILADDGSSDASGAICDEFSCHDCRVRVIHKENSGVSDTRNIALEQAKGEFIQFLDADDWLAPYATRVLAEAAETQNCDMVIADFYRVSGGHVSHKGAIERDKVMTRVEFAGEMMDNPADFYYGVLWNKLYRREIIEKYRLRMLSDISWCEDFMFNLEYIRYAGRFYALQIPICYYVKTKGSLASQGNSITRSIKMKLMVFEYYNDFYRQVLTEEDYEKKKLGIYRFLIDVAADGFVLPSLVSDTKKLGEERIDRGLIESKPENFLHEDYLNRKLLDACLEPIAIKHALSINEIRILLYLNQEPQYQNFKELSGFCGVPYRNLRSILTKLEQKKYIGLEKRGTKKQKEIVFLTGMENLRKDLEPVKNQFLESKLAGFSEEERMEYERLCKKVRFNIEQRLNTKRQQSMSNPHEI